MNLLDNTVDHFTELLASPAPVPGGGGASALCGAIAIALGDMVGELTVGKKKYADVEDEIKALMIRAQHLRFSLLECINKDAECFEPLSKAYGIPKDDPTRDEVMEACLKQAAQAPLEILRLCRDSIGILEEFADKGSVIVISDAATGAQICRGALYGAAINVKVNTKAMKDRDYAEALNAEVDEILSSCVPAADAIYDKVEKRIC